LGPVTSSGWLGWVFVQRAGMSSPAASHMFDAGRCCAASRARASVLRCSARRRVGWGASARGASLGSALCLLCVRLQLSCAPGFAAAAVAVAGQPVGRARAHGLWTSASRSTRSCLRAEADGDSAAASSSGSGLSRRLRQRLKETISEQEVKVPAAPTEDQKRI
ncbi:unnamed protein product, partial [Polarella glacialis]